MEIIPPAELRCLDPYPQPPIPPGVKTVVLTRELLLAGRSSRGGWSPEQLAALNVPHPRGPQWTIRMHGVVVPHEAYVRFMDLRIPDQHLSDTEF